MMKSILDSAVYIHLRPARDEKTYRCELENNESLTVRRRLWKLELGCLCSQVHT